MLRLNGRTVLLILAEAVLVFGATLFAVYLRFGFAGAPYELLEKNGYWKAGMATFFCLAAFYHGLWLSSCTTAAVVLRLIGALGLAWIALALGSMPIQDWYSEGHSLIALPTPSL